MSKKTPANNSCGCRVDVEVVHGYNLYEIEYCPKHAAAPAVLEALKGLAVFGGGEYCFCQHVDTVTNEHTDECAAARHAVKLAGDSDETK